MSFDYEKLKQKHKSDDNSWSSNSDLFMVLSLVFLLLYVVSSLRNGSSSVQQSIQYKELQSRNEDLEQQILAYEALKDDYLKKQATKKEMDMYSELMGKLSLLQEKAKYEKNDLRRKALQNEKKENALNKYQQIIRNIVNTNLLAQKRIHKRDNKIKVQNIKITEKDETITKNKITINTQKTNIEKQQQIITKKLMIIKKSKLTIKRKRIQAKALKRKIYKNTQIIKKNNKRIASIDKALSKNIKRLNKEYKKHKYSKVKLNKRIATLKKQEAKRVTYLKSQNNKTKSKLKTVSKSLKNANNDIESAKVIMAKQAKEQRKLSKLILQKKKEISLAKISYKSQINNLKQKHKSKILNEKKLFDKSIAKQRLSNKQKAKKLKLFKAKVAAAEKGLQVKISSLNSIVKKTNIILNKKSDQLDHQKLAIATMRKLHKNKLAREKQSFEKKLNKQKLSNSLRAKKVKQFKDRMKAEEHKMNSKISSLRNNISNSKNKLKLINTKLKKSEKQRQRSIASTKKLLGKNRELSKNLIKANSLIDTRRKLTQKIIKNLKRAGIKALVDQKSGEVTISFGREYFETGSSILKRGMLASLKKFIPAYSTSVFSDPSIAKKVAAVEVIGFASPTFKGKYVNPKSLKRSDQEAVRFNLKLSQQRANSVFNFMFDKDKLKYKYQRKLYPLVKVTGRSFISREIKNSSRFEGMTTKQFCANYDCKKSQRVIIKFSLKN